MPTDRQSEQSGQKDEADREKGKRPSEARRPAHVMLLV